MEGGEWAAEAWIETKMCSLISREKTHYCKGRLRQGSYGRKDVQGNGNDVDRKKIGSISVSSFNTTQR